jgi:hypothetical protein
VDEFVPRDFDVPRRLETPLFVLEPLGPEHNAQDLRRVDIVHGAHPRDARVAGQQLAAGDDTAREPRRLAAPFRRLPQPHGIHVHGLDQASRDVIGCVYIYPQRDSDYDACAHSWVRASHAHLDAGLWRAVSEWLTSDWPFASVEYAARA